MTEPTRTQPNTPNAFSFATAKADPAQTGSRFAPRAVVCLIAAAGFLLVPASLKYLPFAWVVFFPTPACCLFFFFFFCNKSNLQVIID